MLFSKAIRLFGALTTFASFAQANLASTAPPVPGLPFDVSIFTDTVASVQNTYCGASKNQPGVKFGDQTLLYAYGDGVTTQRCNIYHSDSLGIIVAYEGTNASSIISISFDVAFVQAIPDPALGLPVGALVSSGFQAAWLGTWSKVSRGLSQALATYPGSPIVVTGHSLGAAQALLGALAINKAFPNTIDKVITYGGPRTGNVIFANAFDSIFNGSFTGVINGQDWVPRVPFPEMNYWHPSGLVWINPANTTSWSYYPGQENVNLMSQQQPKFFYPNSAQLYFGDHQGIYMHSSMGTTLGPCPAVVGGY